MQQESGGYTELVDLVPRLKLDEFRALAEKHFEETGDLLPGTEDRAERETFTVKFGKQE